MADRWKETDERLASAIMHLKRIAEEVSAAPESFAFDDEDATLVGKAQETI